MHYNDTFCPLGILCEISKIGEWKEDPYHKEIKYYDVGLSELNRAVFFPPKQVYDWAGLSKDESKYMTAFVATFNDGGASFKEVADALIEKYKIKDTIKI